MQLYYMGCLLWETVVLATIFWRIPDYAVQQNNDSAPAIVCFIMAWLLDNAYWLLLFEEEKNLLTVGY